MQNKKTNRRTKTSRHNDNTHFFMYKGLIQSITALIIFLVVWGMSVSNQPAITAMCEKVKYYLTYTYDVKSVFNQFNNSQEVNDDTH